MKEIGLKIENEKHLSKTMDVKSRYDGKQKEKIASATKQFESLLTSMMLKSMSTSNKSMFGEEGTGNDMFDSVFEQEISNKITETKSLGVAELLYKKITGEEMSSEMRIKLNNRINPIKIHNTQAPADSSRVQPSGNAIERLNKLDNHINEASESFGVDKNIIKSIIMTESAANNKAVSSAKAKGLMQLIDSTASDMGVRNVFDPKENINGGTKYFAKMLRQYDGDIKMALAAYNAGPKNVEKYNGIPPFDETKSYIKKVLNYLEHFNESEK